MYVYGKTHLEVFISFEAWLDFSHGAKSQILLNCVQNSILLIASERVQQSDLENKEASYLKVRELIVQELLPNVKFIFKKEGHSMRKKV